MPPDAQMLHAPSKGRRPDPPLARSRLPLALTAVRAGRRALRGFVFIFDFVTVL